MLFKPQERTSVDKELDNLFSELRSHDAGSEEYATILDRIIKVHKMQAEEKPDRVSADTLAMIGANLAGLVLILSFERLNVISRNAMSLINLRPR